MLFKKMFQWKALFLDNYDKNLEVHCKCWIWYRFWI